VRVVILKGVFMSGIDTSLLIRLLKIKSDELMDSYKVNRLEEYFELSCDCANIANRLLHLDS